MSNTPSRIESNAENHVRGAAKHPEQRKNNFKGELIMKKTRRFAATIAAMALAATMVAPTMMNASAEDTNKITVTATDGATHTYEAYQIFSGDLDEGVLKNIDWGNGVNGSSLLTALKGDSTIGSYFENASSASDVATILGDADKFADDNANMQTFAKLVGANLTTTKAGTAGTGQVTGLADGYYLVQDSAKPTGGTVNGGAKTRWIVKVAGADVSVNAKHSAPTVMKKVEEIGYNASGTTGDTVQFGNDTDSTTAGVQNDYLLEKDYNDVADYNIGDAVSFTLYGSLPDTYADYDHYYYKFVDTLSAGFVTPNVSDITVYLNGTAITEQQKTDAGVTITSEANADGGTDIGVVIMDVKELTTNANDIITVKYDATLDTDSVIGLDGNENKVKLEYSNNPNSTGDGTTKPSDDDTSETPEDKVIVFTYEQDFNKKDASNQSAIIDAEFKLSRTVDGTTTWLVATQATSGVEGTYIVSSWVGDEANATVLKTTDGTYKVKGLEDGSYTVKETKIPATYNDPKDVDTDLVITATTANGQTWSGTASDALTALTLTATNEDTNAVTVIKGVAADTSKQDLTNGIVEATIYNTKGTQLPSTGGMGTKLFIAGGGITATLAAVYLVSKKRSRKEEE